MATASYPARARSILGNPGLLSLVALIAACKSNDPPVALAANPPAAAAARARAIMPSASNEWTQPSGDYAMSRFSSLAQITTANVAQLKVASAFSTGVLHGHEGNPLVVNNVMYVVTPYPNILYAIDLTQPGGAVQWIYQPRPSDRAVGIACCDVVNRGATYANGRIYYNTLDAHTVAVDARTGKEIWNVTVGNIDIGETMTMAPLVVKNKVIVGNSGAELGVRGWVKALDAGTGKELWRAYSTGPDSDVRIGPTFRPFYPDTRGTDLGVKTWSGEQWKLGGGTVWGWLSYDPDLNLFYYGTANPGVWNPDMRPGDNKWSTTIFARDPDNGEARWAYQMTPHDAWDYDGVNENMLADIQVDGRRRKVLVHPDRNGFVYTLDRETGEVITAGKFVFTNWADSINRRTGRPVENSAFRSKQGVVTRGICPSSTGGKDEPPGAFSPQTGWFYFANTNDCMDYEGLEANYIAGTPYVGASVRMYAGPGGKRGGLNAWDAALGKAVWHIDENFPVWSGVLATQGGVVFYGTMDGWFKAVDAKDGHELWKFKVGSGIVGNPITYTGPDGKQYVAVYSGIGGWMGAVAFPDVSTSDPYTGLGVAGAIPDIKQASAMGGTLYVFSL
ncbi:MAG TPA: methanol/ethanol family PQQ-dependent dehydrogenase [Gemmatimonadales bacterium]|nr:methanol/ethanol family PQQ-dependent dehydrogenase [Gemmatimonadales bacterium]